MIRRKRSVAGTLDETRYLLKDYLDPAAVIDTSAAVVERFGYDAFGPVRFMDAAFATRAASTTGWNFLFHAEFLDADSGLYNYGYRYLHPQLGRWLSRDPIAEEGGLNLYGFVGNAGISRLDMLGLDSPGCDGIPDLTPCMLEVCAAHDKCYADNKCTMKSWFSATGKCSDCNFQAVLGMIKCLSKLCYDDKEKPNYYDAVTDSFFNDPKDPRMWNTTDKVKPPKPKVCCKKRLGHPGRR